MSFRFKLAISVVVIVLASACSEDSPFLTKKQLDELIEEINNSRDPFYTIKDIVAIINNDVYYFDRLDTIPRRLTFTNTAAKTHVKLSFDKTQVAYLNAAGNPVIIRSDNGELVQTLTQFSNIDQMDWAKDRLSLYMLIDREVVTYGEPLEIIQPDSNNSWDEVPSFSMNSIGDQGYFIHYYGASGYDLNYHSEQKDIDDDDVDLSGRQFDYIDFYDNTGSFLLGYNDPFDEGLSQIVCVKGYLFWTAYEYHAENMNSPEFNRDIEVLMYGTVENQQYAIKAVYLGYDAYPHDGQVHEILTKVLTDYESETPVYLDWVH